MKVIVLLINYIYLVNSNKIKSRDKIDIFYYNNFKYIIIYKDFRANKYIYIEFFSNII